jgi:homoserine O-succinyltransferase/O-acetyltransferase
MPLIITAQHPPQWTLESDGIFVIPAADAARQDIRPLRVLLVDLMPETVGLRQQLERLLGNSPLQIELTVAQLGTTGIGRPSPWDVHATERFDGLVITNAAAGERPVHALPVWDELRDLLDWSQDHVHAALFLGWSALAALDHFYSVPAVALPSALVGVYRHRVRRRQSYLLRGFDDVFDAPISRHHQPDPTWLRDSPWLEILAESDEGGASIIRNRSRRQVFITDAPHYEPGHLVLDQGRLAAGTDGQRFTLPHCTWRAHAQLLFANWLNYYVYQASPYHLDQLTPMVVPPVAQRRTPLPGVMR